MGIFHRINIFSQALNWIITILYFFFNSAVTYMKGVVEVDAMKYNDRQDLREMQKHYAVLMTRHAESGSGEDLESGDLHQFCAQLDTLILGMANCKDLEKDVFKKLDTDWKFKVLQKLLTKKGARFAKA